MRDRKDLTGCFAGCIELVEKFFLITNINCRDSVGGHFFAAEDNIPVEHPHLREQR